MKIYVGADHNGFHQRKALVNHLKHAGYEVVDDGDTELDPQDDFPVFATKVAKDVLGSDDKDARGILLCGSGQGMCIAANRFRGIRAALGYDTSAIRSSRNDDDVNVLCLPARALGSEEMFSLVDAFLNTKFAGAPRFARRIQEIDEI